MLKKSVAAIALAAFMGTVGLEFAAAPARAAVTYVPAPTLQGDPNIQQVATFVYVKGKHGKRYKAKRAGYGYYYGGFWYAKPWWKYGGGPVVWVYNPNKYGPRYKAKRAGYGYFYKGYYYKRPYWKY
jgi:hypothetical protein